jgi:hypothetical protein
MEANHVEKEQKFTLREIASWGDVNRSTVKIPDIQRGLVWKSRQIEFLWDSMLRGFPIGSFILSDADGSYYLLDGQQRFNAVATGFGSIKRDDAMLWLDICPSFPQNSTRVFLIKATTTAHPWGFNNDDSCSPLSAEKRRNALKMYGKENQSIYKNNISLNETWPIMANKPIPLRFFLAAPLDSEDSFAQYIVDQYQKQKSILCANLNEDDKNAIKEYYYTFNELSRYTIPCSILTRDVIEKESSEKKESDETTPLEILFNRLNTGGTRISEDDLNYSAIKAYWGNIKEANDSIAKRYMPASKLVMIAFRLALTKMDKSKGLRNPLSIRQIRSLAKNPSARDKVTEVYDNLDSILRMIDSWLNVFDTIDKPNPNAMPAFIRTSIARNSPDIFLLLMYLASESIDHNNTISPSEAKGLSLLLHWLAIDKKNAAGIIFRNINEKIDTTHIQKGISECISLNYLLPIYSPSELQQFIQIKPEAGWSPWMGKDYAPWHDFYLRISNWGNNEAQEMLLFAQREYINTQFCLFDPAREDMWESHNRPWDYDHIIPRNWIKERGRARTEYRDYCDYWVDRIGNIGAIPFEDNRAKRDREAYEIYEKNAKALLFDFHFLDFTKLNIDLTKNPDGSFNFAKLVFKRTLDIFGQSYNLFSQLVEKTVLTDRQIHRKRMMESIASKLDNAQKVFVARGGELWREYPIQRESDWSREWISVGVPRKNKYFISFTWGCNEEDHLEIGIRKLPGMDINKDISDLPVIDRSYWTGIGDWWYAEKSIVMDEEKILTEMKDLLLRCDLICP